MVPRRSKRQRRDSVGVTVAEPEQQEEQPPSPGVEEPQQLQASGHPFTDLQVTWEYERIKLVDRDKKVVLTGYETMAGEINAVLKTLTDKSAVGKVKKSTLGCYLGIPDYNTRSGSMIHYIVCHQVTPTPNFDPTSLFFNIGDTIIRFSWVEYALVSGLRFGQASFNPYARHELPPNSIYHRLFGENEETSTADVKTSFINKQFTVKKKKAKASDDEFVKLAKLLIACAFVMGFPARKKIPKWLWVLVEDEQKWEDFPWGSISYQVLVETVNGVTKLERGSKQVTYQFKGNTIAFSAWIFEAVPSFGEIVGRKKTKRVRPRFMRYVYVKERGYPTQKQITEKVVPMLKPQQKELEKNYWKSLEQDPEGAPFALLYDANDSKRKRPRDDEADGEDNQIHARGGNSSSAAPTLKQIEELLTKYHSSLVDAVAERVVSMILEKAPDARDNIQPSAFEDHRQMPTHEHGSNNATNNEEQNLVVNTDVGNETLEVETAKLDVAVETGASSPRQAVADGPTNPTGEASELGSGVAKATAEGAGQATAEGSEVGQTSGATAEGQEIVPAGGHV